MRKNKDQIQKITLMKGMDRQKFVSKINSRINFCENKTIELICLLKDDVRKKSK